MSAATLSDIQSWINSNNAHPATVLTARQVTDRASKLVPHCKMIEGALSIDATQTEVSKMPSGEVIPTRVTTEALALATQLRELIDRGVIRGVSLADENLEEIV